MPWLFPIPSGRVSLVHFVLALAHPHARATELGRLTRRCHQRHRGMSNAATSTKSRSYLAHRPETPAPRSRSPAESEGRLESFPPTDRRTRMRPQPASPCGMCPLRSSPGEGRYCAASCPSVALQRSRQAALDGAAAKSIRYTKCTRRTAGYRHCNEEGGHTTSLVQYLGT